MVGSLAFGASAACVDEQFLIDEASFNCLCSQYGAGCEKVDNTGSGGSLRKAVDRKKRLAITLLWLAHGSGYYELAWSYDVGKTTVSQIIHSFLEVLF